MYTSDEMVKFFFFFSFQVPNCVMVKNFSKSKCP